jgi:SAM-dependent methyltransferase
MITENYRHVAYSRYETFPVPDYSRLAGSYRRKMGGRLDLKPDDNCLDLACGFGNFLGYLKEEGVGSYAGVDSSEVAVSTANRYLGEDCAVHGDVVQYLTQTRLQYSLVSALDFIEHLSKDEIFHLLPLVRSIQPVGGRLLLRTPNAASPFGMSARYGDITHEVCFTSAALADVLRSNGYQVISCWEDGPTLGTVKQSLHWLAWNIVRGIIGLASAAESGAWGDAIYTRNFWLLARKVEE